MGSKADIWMLDRYRRLSKDYEGLPESSEAMIYAALARLMVKRPGRMGPSSQ
jgi:putative transposase